MGREGESFQSPEQQRDTIRAWAKLRGVEIAEWSDDIDKSGNVLPGRGSMTCSTGSGAVSSTD